MAPDQVKQRKEKDPDNIDEMPVQARHFHRRMIGGRVNAAAGLYHENRKHPDSDDHVQGMKAGHGEIHGKEQLHLPGVWTRIRECASRNQVVLEFIGIFDSLDSQKGQTEQHRKNEKSDQRLAVSDLRAMHRQRHRQTAADQYGRVHSAQGYVEVAAGIGESGRIERPVHDVGGKYPAEEHDLGDQKDPHSQRRCLVLLLETVEVMLQG